MHIKYSVFVNIYWVEDNEILKFQRIFAKHFNVKSQIKSMFTAICNSYDSNDFFDKFANTYYSVVIKLIYNFFIRIKMTIYSIFFNSK